MKWIDPTSPAYGASGSSETTAGTISAGSNSLSVASPNGWASGMGIVVSAAGAGNFDLTTSVIGVSGNNLILAQPAQSAVTNNTIFHDDTAALSEAMNSGMSSGIPLWLPIGNYNITSALPPISTPLSMQGQDIYGTVINNRAKNNNLFTISYAESSSPSVIKKASTIGNFQVSQDSNVAPTGGTVFTVGNPSGLTTGLRMQDIVFNGVWEGLRVNAGQISNWFDRLYFRNLMSGNAIVYNSPGPSGDCHFRSIECSGYNTGILIEQADTHEWYGLKTNFSGVKFAAPNSASDINRVRFINCSIEGDGSSPSYGYDFGQHGAAQASIIGGGVGIMPHAFNNLAAAKANGCYGFTNVYSTQDAFSGWVEFGNITQL